LDQHQTGAKPGQGGAGYYGPTAPLALPLAISLDCPTGRANRLQRLRGQAQFEIVAQWLEIELDRPLDDAGIEVKPSASSDYRLLMGDTRRVGNDYEVPL